jgi:AraC-like DNA-binding protein
VEARKLRAHLSNTALIHTGLRLHVVHNERVINEDVLLMRAFARAGHVERPSATVLLGGRARISLGDHHVWMKPGDVVTVSERGGIQMRQEGEPYYALAFEWDAAFGTGEPEMRTYDGHARLGTFGDVAEAVRARGNPAELVAELMSALSALGVPIRAVPASALDEPVPEHMQQLTHALDAALSTLGDQPMITDLESEIGLSPRQLNRLIADYNARYGFNALGWIDTRNRRRLLMGATFMTAPGATVAYVAKQVGYRSGSAFARALRLVGLPPPQDIRGEVERILLAHPPPAMSG